ncbi:hypothetical protein K431DRAFT_274712 [Polychaeton citri CBS 116435]|uniref:Protein transport protein SEC31 n=1 Tax=Polychaeton citri CBS 116435 TaxID=1314669 RepID=A0A9P4Q2R7_9PEZI|nr:hypothetical protein K431DRAFT_274712 [Polychaeton citri CBS 116435]
MVRLREIPRTAVFAWSPGSQPPLVVTGTRAGAVNDDFSSDVKLELWDLGLQDAVASADLPLTPVASATVDSGFNDLTWSQPTDDHPLGLIAGALENGSVDLWDAEKLRKGDVAPLSRTSKHSGPVKAIQFNGFRHNLLASVGANGEIFVYDINNMGSPFRLGATAARADDIECLDWNKSEKTAHILATGSSGGFVTVWDVKQKRDILTLNNSGRKAVSAVAWDPQESTKLATASPNDQEPAIFLWSLRNSSAPERVLKGHELGVLALNWCLQDPELLLSSGKDNKTICWNPRTGEAYGDFAAGSNWAFQTKWNPHNPNLIASASFDGNILITSIQSTNSKTDDQATANQSLDDGDFFAKAQTQPKSISFSLSKAPRWVTPPTSVSFGYGGKLVRISKNQVKIDTFKVDNAVGEAAAAFDEQLRAGDLASICASKVEQAKTDEEKADWQVIDTLNSGKSRKKLRQYLGFEDEVEAEAGSGPVKAGTNGITTKGEKSTAKDDDDDAFFGGNSEDTEDAFLAELAATKGVKTNKPFSIYSGSESEADKNITKALLLGKFEAALDVALAEERMSDAFMIAVCGGQKCIDKVQTAYLKNAKGSSYLRLLASVVGKNLWDIAHNADLADWKEIMATICTYADETEFADLCEALGDRLEEAYNDGGTESARRRDASFCYLAGSKLEKVVNNWVQELREQEKSALEDLSGDDSAFAVHVKSLKDFIEKVDVFRAVTGFQDDGFTAEADFKLSALYNKYTEYADILASHGELASAQRYLSLLPAKYDGAEAAQERVRHATRKAAPGAAQKSAAATTTQRLPVRTGTTPVPYAPAAPLSAAPPGLVNQAVNNSPYMPVTAQSQPPVTARGPYAPPNPIISNTASTNYQPSAPNAYGTGYAPPQQASLPPPPRASTSSPSVPPPGQAKGTANWNDMPENFLKSREPRSRGNTPAPSSVTSPFPYSHSGIASPPPPGPPLGGGSRVPSTLPPPPRAGEAPPRITSPPQVQGGQMRPHPPPSTAASMYAPSHASISSPPPPLGAGSSLPPPAGPPPIARGASPYQPPPSTSSAAPSSRYAPTPGSVPSPAPGIPPPRNVAPNPYAAPSMQSNPYAPSQPQHIGFGQPPSVMKGPPQGPPPASVGPPPAGPPRGPPRAAPPPGGPPPATGSRPSTARSGTASPAPSLQPGKHPRGDRSHISPAARPIPDILAPAVDRLKAAAPQKFKLQVDDTEKRLNILLDALNNSEIPDELVGELVELSRSIERKEWDEAQRLFGTLQAEGLWMVGLKRLIALGKAANI